MIPNNSYNNDNSLILIEVSEFISNDTNGDKKFEKINIDDRAYIINEQYSFGGTGC